MAQAAKKHVYPYGNSYEYTYVKSEGAVALNSPTKDNKIRQLAVARSRILL